MTTAETYPPLSRDERELWESVQHLWELSLDPDASRIAELLHPDYVGWDTRSPSTHTRDAAVSSVSDAPGRTIEYSLEPLSVRVYQGRFGVVHYRYKAVVEAGGGERREIEGGWTEMYVKDGARWLMVAVSGRPETHDAA